MQLAIQIDDWNTTTIERLSSEFALIAEQITDDISSRIDVIVSLPNIIQLSGNRLTHLAAIQDILCSIYGRLSAIAFQKQLYFMDINVIIAGHCGYDPLSLYDDSQVLRISAKSDISNEGTSSLNHDQNDRQTYSHVAVGGTFDHLHAGHKILLSIAAWICKDKLTCGVFRKSQSS